MSTRGLVAVAEGTSWTGFYVHGDAYPDGVGAELLALLRKHGLQDCTQRIRAATLIGRCRERATPASFGNQGDLEWFYLLDPATGSLRIYCEGPQASPDAPAGFTHARWLEVGRHLVAADGRCTPPTMRVVVPPPWPRMAVTQGWPVDDRAAARRLDVRRRVERDAPDMGSTLPGVRDLLEFALSEALFHAPWKDRPTTRLFVRMPWTVLSKYLAVPLGGLLLHYPADDWSRTTRDSRLELFSEPALDTELSISREDVLARLPEWRRLEGVLISAFPSENWFFAALDLIRERHVADPRGEEMERLATPADKANDWRVFTHPDGRVWSIRPSSAGFQLRLGADDDDPVFKERKGELQPMIDEQLADGFVERR